MNKLSISLLLIFFSGLLFSQEIPSIHQEQSEFYGAQNLPAEWYEENVNTEVYNFSDQRSNCNLNKVVYGWHPYWVGSAFNNYDWNLLSHFSYFSYEVDETTGDPITTHGWANADAVDSALANGVKVTLCVTLFGGTDLTTFLTNNAAKQNLIANLINLVQTRGAHGVNIDFEGLPASQKTNFANFMVDLSNQMHTAIPGSEVSTVLYAVDWSNVFDFAIMDPVVDHFIVMGYAYYYQGSSTTGPCDPLYHFGSTYNYTLSKTATYYIDKGCSPSKFVMGLPYYGYEWPTTDLSIPSNTTGSGIARTFSYVMNNTSGNYSPSNHTWDSESYTDIFTFISGGNKECFITLEDGFRKRLEHVNNTGIAGIGIWALGYDNGYNELWNGINDYLTDCKVDPCSGTIHDFGGPEKNYYNDENYTWTISPDGASSIDISFSTFSVESGYDTLFIYDGASTNDPMIGAYTGSNSPGNFTTSSGDVTFYWKSDGATVGAGWLADYVCGVSTSNPIAGFNAPANNTICQGESIQFVNASQNATNYFWEFQGGFPSTSTVSDPLVTYNVSGNYNVVLNAIDGVDTSTIVQSITVNIANQPIAAYSSNAPTYYPNTAIYFTNSSSNASSYYWDFGDGSYSSDSNPWHDYVNSGTYFATLISSNFICPNDTLVKMIEIIDNVSIADLETEHYGVFPNPFNNEIYISGIENKEIKIVLMDAAGRIILDQNDFDWKLMRFTELQYLADGMYIIEITDSYNTERSTLIKN